MLNPCATLAKPQPSAQAHHRRICSFFSGTLLRSGSRSGGIRIGVTNGQSVR